MKSYSIEELNERMRKAQKSKREGIPGGKLGSALRDKDPRADSKEGLGEEEIGRVAGLGMEFIEKTLGKNQAKG
jgi:hypothetical protein